MTNAQDRPRILLVMPPQSGQPVIEALTDLGLTVIQAEDCGAARAALHSRRDIQVVVSSVTLPDGNWRMIQNELIDRGVAAEIVVVLPESPLQESEIEAYGATAVKIDDAEALRRSVADAARKTLKRGAAAG